MRPGVATESRFLSKILGSLVLVVIVVVVASVFMLSPLGMSWLAKWMGAEYKTGIDAAKLVYSWPTSVGVCIVLALGLFRTPLAGLIERLELFKGGPVEVRARVAASVDSDPHRDLLRRIEAWAVQEDHWVQLSSWAQRKGEPSAPMWLNSAGVPELQELVDTLGIS